MAQHRESLDGNFVDVVVVELLDELLDCEPRRDLGPQWAVTAQRRPKAS